MGEGRPVIGVHPMGHAVSDGNQQRHAPADAETVLKGCGMDAERVR